MGIAINYFQTMSKHRTALLISFLFCCIFSLSAEIPTYTLQEALAKRLVAADIRGVDSIQTNSTNHYGKCMQVTLTNTTSRPFNVSLEAGALLDPDDTAVQVMLVTEGVMFELKARSKVKKYVNALCTQMHDAAPANTYRFSKVRMSDGNMNKLAKLIEQNKYHDSTAQLALWCLTDNVDIIYVKGNNAEEVNTLQKFVSEATGQPVPVYKNGELVITATETIEWGAPKEHTATLLVYNSKGKVVQTILKDEKLPVGYQSRQVVISTPEYALGEYKVILYLDGKKQMTRTVKLER